MPKIVDKKIVRTVGDTLLIRHEQMETDKHYHFTWLDARCYAVKSKDGKLAIFVKEHLI